MGPHYARIERGVAPLWAMDGAHRELLGVCTIVEPERGPPVALTLSAIVTSAAPRALFVGADFGHGVIAVTNIARTRWLALSKLELAPTRWPTDDISPVPVARLSGFRSAPDATHFAVALDASEASLQRRSVPLAVRDQRYASRGGAGDDVDLLLAAHAGPAPPAAWRLAGAPVIAQLPASRRLGTPAEDRLLGVLLPSASASHFAGDGFAPWAELVQIELR